MEPNIDVAFGLADFDIFTAKFVVSEDDYLKSATESPIKTVKET